MTVTGERQWITLHYFEDAQRIEPLWGPQTGHGALCCCQFRSSEAQGSCCCPFYRGDTEFKFSLSLLHSPDRYFFILVPIWDTAPPNHVIISAGDWFEVVKPQDHLSIFDVGTVPRHAATPAAPIP